MKIKVLPDDFVVREIADLKIKSDGPYAVYVLEKIGWNTAHAICRVARELNISPRAFSYGGKKDRHAHTFQYITVKKGLASGRPMVSEILHEDSWSFRFLGYADRPIGPDLIVGNAFDVTLRSLDTGHPEIIRDALYQIREYGFPNYFDDQRFGSVDREEFRLYGGGFVAERLVKRQWRGALKLYLTAVYPEEKRNAKERKRFFARHWGDWEACVRRAETAFERRAFSTLMQKPGRYLEALRLIPSESLSMIFSAYQSFLWNEVLRRLLRKLGVNLLYHPGVTGPYLFFDGLDYFQSHYLRTLQIPLPAADMEPTDPLVEELFSEVLVERGVSLAQFNLRQLRQGFFKSHQRAAVVAPEGLETGSPEDDEIYPGKLKLALRFRLPRGSYATMMVKRLMATIASAMRPR